MIDSAFSNINRLFVLSFKNGDDNHTINSFDKYYMSLIQINDFNALRDNKPLFDQAVWKKEEAYEKLVKMSRNDGYKTGNLLDYFYHQKYYKPIGIVLLSQTNTNIPQKLILQKN